MFLDEKLRTRSWQDEAGQQRYVTELHGGDGGVFGRTAQLKCQGAASTQAQSRPPRSLRRRCVRSVATALRGRWGRTRYGGGTLGAERNSEGVATLIYENPTPYGVGFSSLSYHSAPFSSGFGRGAGWWWRGAASLLLRSPHSLGST